MTPRQTVELVILAALWGASFLFMRIAAPEFGPVPLITLRVLIAAMFLIPVVLYRGTFGSFAANWAKISAVGTLNSAIPFSLLAFSTLTLTAGFTSILNGTTPLFGALLALFWLRERPSAGRVLGLLVGFVGVVVLVWPKVGGGSAEAGAGVAIAAGTFAASLYAVAAIFTRKHLSHVGPLALAMGTQIGAFAVLLPFAIMNWPSEPISREAWISVVILGVACTGLAHIIYFRLIAGAGPSNAMTVTYLIPAFAMLWGALALGEAVTGAMLIGCGIVLLGTALATGLLKLPGRR